MKPTRALACALLVATLAAGCGSTGRTEPPKANPTPSTPDGAWLLRINTAEGADGEFSRSVYVRFDPESGAATVARMPRVTGGTSYGAAQALLVDAGRAWSLADTTVGAEGKQGRVTLYSTTGPGTSVLPLRTWTGDTRLRPVAAAFDPAKPGLLRVVDDRHRVWQVDVAARTATAAGTLAVRTGWVFGNGFDKNSGLPFIEAVDTEATEPAGNGIDDARPVERDGGRLLSYDGTALPGLPALPCGFAGGFTDAEGTSWVFCADTPRITTYKVAEDGEQWQRFGTPSAPVVPPAASEIAVALPISSAS
ncbi:MAG: hypothetical protein J7518_14450 [Nocardioidaceae bacterium]|nr:hypothetical protein [Nocardioidaceae bacterium]